MKSNLTSTWHASLISFIFLKPSKKWFENVKIYFVANYNNIGIIWVPDLNLYRGKKKEVSVATILQNLLSIILMVSFSNHFQYNHP